MSKSEIGFLAEATVFANRAEDLLKEPTTARVAEANAYASLASVKAMTAMATMAMALTGHVIGMDGGKLADVALNDSGDAA
jgi:hypothetical protein